MTVEAKKETLGFETEVKHLLHLMIHSLYRRHGKRMARLGVAVPRCSIDRDQIP